MNVFPVVVVEDLGASDYAQILKWALPICMAVDIMSLVVTYVLIKRACASKAIAKTCGHLVIDFAFVVCASLISYSICFGGMTSVLQQKVNGVAAPVVRTPEFSSLRSLLMFRDILPAAGAPQVKDSTRQAPSTSYADVSIRLDVVGPFLILGATSAAPTAAYASICCALILLRFSPQGARRLLQNTVYLVWDGRKPVFQQLGNAFGTMAALLAALVSLLS